jgi:hypothetical protein
MPRYFFHLRDGRTSLDDDGTELPDIHAARRTAITLSGETLKDGASDTLWEGAPWQICLQINRTARARHSSPCISPPS